MPERGKGERAFVAACGRAKAAEVCGEQRRRQRAGRRARRRQRGQHHRKAAAPHAGKILDAQNRVLPCHSAFSSLRDPALVPRRFHVGLLPAPIIFRRLPVGFASAPAPRLYNFPAPDAETCSFHSKHQRPKAFLQYSTAAALLKAVFLFTAQSFYPAAWSCLPPCGLVCRPAVLFAALRFYLPPCGFICRCGRRTRSAESEAPPLIIHNFSVLFYKYFRKNTQTLL